jgi:hypothetical protein
MSREAGQTLQPDAQPLWFAGFIAGVSAPFAYWVVLVVIELVTRGEFLDANVMQTLAMLAMVGVPVCLLVTFVFGFPLALLLRKLGKLSALNLCVGAVAIGAMMAAAVAKLFFPSNPVDIAIPGLGAATGLFAGIVFCLVGSIPFRRTIP